MEFNNKESRLTLKQQYEIDKERRLNKTIELLTQVAEENMSGKEKEEFLANLPEVSPTVEATQETESSEIDSPEL